MRSPGLAEMNFLSRSIAENHLHELFALASGSEWRGYPIETPSQGVNNQTFLVRGEDSGLVLKLRPTASESAPGPSQHWPAYTCALFGDRPNGDLNTLVDVTALLQAHGSIPVPRIFRFDTSVELSRSFLVSELMPGMPFDWSTRTLGRSELEQLGRHLARMHSATNRQSFGIFDSPDQPRSEWWPRFARSYSVLVDALAAASDRVADLRPRLEAAMNRAAASGDPDAFALICIDQSPSHYLGDGLGSISGFVDIEGHLWAPPEWELAALGCWVPDVEALRLGYEAVRQWPVNLEVTRSAYQAYTIMEWIYCTRYLVGNTSEAERLDPHLEWKLDP